MKAIYNGQPVKVVGFVGVDVGAIRVIYTDSRGYLTSAYMDSELGGFQIVQEPTVSPEPVITHVDGAKVIKQKR